MDKGLVSLWLQLVLTVILFETGSCIRCHSCLSLHEEKCADPASWELKAMECNRDMVEDTWNSIGRVLAGHLAMPPGGHEYQCFKLNVIMNTIEHNKTTVRGCQYAKTDRYDPCKDIQSRARDSSAIQFCETCIYQECNSSNRIRNSSLLTVLLFPLLAVLFVTRQ